MWDTIKLPVYGQKAFVSAEETYCTGTQMPAGSYIIHGFTEEDLEEENLRGRNPRKLVGEMSASLISLSDCMLP